MYMIVLNTVSKRCQKAMSGLKSIAPRLFIEVTGQNLRLSVFKNPTIVHYSLCVMQWTYGPTFLLWNYYLHTSL